MRRDGRFGAKIVKIGAILAIFWPFEVDGANFYWSQLFRDGVTALGPPEEKQRKTKKTKTRNEEQTLTQNKEPLGKN